MPRCWRKVFAGQPGAFHINLLPAPFCSLVVQPSPCSRSHLLPPHHLHPITPSRDLLLPLLPIIFLPLTPNISLAPSYTLLLPCAPIISLPFCYHLPPLLTPTPLCSLLLLPSLASSCSLLFPFAPTISLPFLPPVPLCSLVVQPSPSERPQFIFQIFLFHFWAWFILSP